ncbi:opine metallophore biosynthesis dehydrogenase [Vibrio neptunius]|uniref:opine metallophore biosynthesis dehydrogenase n=1 Tax=Vibrio neptunius TaxID=170651 RepID=UPI0033154A03
MTKAIGRLLIVGAGPAGIQTAALLQDQATHIGIASRPSARWQRHGHLLKDKQAACVNVAKSNLAPLARTVMFDEVFDDLLTLEGEWDTLVIATPSYALASVLLSLPIGCLQSVRDVVLLSSWVGGHKMTQGYFAERGLNPNIVVFSNYYAATKFDTDSSTVNVLTKAVKKRIYAHVSQGSKGAFLALSEALSKVGTDVKRLESGYSVEGRNITLYVHPAFFLTPFSLDHIFGSSDETKYMYKLFPEGPITPATMKTMVGLWQDLSLLMRQLGGVPFNLLQFLNDDNYPVHEETLSRHDIDTFADCQPIEQEYRLYVRYSAILIDPFSVPDEQGRYFDFSAVPFARGDLEHQSWPRIPSEDIHALYWVRALAHYVGLALPTVSRLLDEFEQWLCHRQIPNHFLESSHCHETQSLQWLALLSGDNHE